VAATTTTTTEPESSTTTTVRFTTTTQPPFSTTTTRPSSASTTTTTLPLGYSGNWLGTLPLSTVHGSGCANFSALVLEADITVAGAQRQGAGVVVMFQPVNGLRARRCTGTLDTLPGGNLYLKSTCSVAPPFFMGFSAAQVSADNLIGTLYEGYTDPTGGFALCRAEYKGTMARVQ